MADPTPIIPPAANPVQDSLVSNLKNLFVLVGGLLAAHGVVGPNGSITPERWEFIVGFIVTLAPFAYSWFEKFKAAKTAKERQAIVVNATLNLVSHGAAIATDGTLVPPPPVPLKPASVASAAAIVQNFGKPSGSEVTADDLNSAELAALRHTNG